MSNLFTFKVQRTPGFRLNLMDMLFIGFLIGLSGLFYYLLPSHSLYGLPLYVGFTFFCFCNVFRIGNKVEAFWYIPFAVAAVYCLNNSDFELLWTLVLFLLEPWKWILIGYCILRRPYHGIGYQQVAALRGVSVHSQKQ